MIKQGRDGRKMKGGKEKRGKREGGKMTELRAGPR